MKRSKIIKEGKRSRIIKASTKAGKKGSVKTPTAKSAESAKAGNAKSSKAKAAPKGNTRGLRLTHRVD
jgi:hypothetical protein